MLLTPGKSVINIINSSKTTVFRYFVDRCRMLLTPETDVINTTLVLKTHVINTTLVPKASVINATLNPDAHVMNIAFEQMCLSSPPFPNLWGLVGWLVGWGGAGRGGAKQGGSGWGEVGRGGAGAGWGEAGEVGWSGMGMAGAVGGEGGVGRGRGRG
jgi:hypothetical protein